MSFAMHQPSRVERSLLVGAMLLGFISCGHDNHQEVYPVAGKVLYQGNPAEGATVTLNAMDSDAAKTPKPGGQVQKNGEFRLSTFRSFDGAPAGRYAVTLVYPSADRKENGENVGPDVLRGRYADPKTTPFHVEIKRQDNRLETFNIR